MGLLFFGCTGFSGSGNSSANATPYYTANITPPSQPPRTAATGDVVSVWYVGSFENGTVFDTNLREEAARAGLPLRPQYPLLTFQVGAGQLIPGFESAVVGMKEGETKSVRLEPFDAYGEYLEELVLPVNISIFQLREGKNLTVGGQVQTTNGMIGRIASIENDTVLVDFNDPLAGKTLVFRISVQTIARAVAAG